MRSFTLLSLLLAALALATPAAAQTQPQRMRHDIEVRFDASSRALHVADTVTLTGRSGDIPLILSQSVREVRAEDIYARPLRTTRLGDIVRVKTAGNIVVEAFVLRYTLPLADPPETAPASLDNPGAVAADTVAGKDWAMLMPASLWHPASLSGEDAYRLRVLAPRGVKAVTQGRSEGFTEKDGSTVSTWNVAQPVGRLGLCLAKYDVQERQASAAGMPVTVQTFLLPASARLAPTYLDATARHLDFYAKLHGPYPLEKFAVVENPLPTGFGFPSYTLLGSQVLALPFIPEISLRHEVAHGWWGNGVLVARESGNWCEGLTTYVADYLSQEAVSPKDAKAYRQRALRAFAALAATGGDMPLENFGARFSPASQAVGYGKAMFVFHMLRGFTTDKDFWAGLRDLYARWLFKPAAWDDIREVMEGKGEFTPSAAKRFMEQWLARPGGPVLELKQASAEPDPAGGWIVRGVAAQKGAPYLLRLTAEAVYGGGAERCQFLLTGAEAPFTLHTPSKPERIVLDPDADCFRLLSPEEIPLSVNTVKGARGLTVVLAEDAGAALRDALPTLLAGLGQEKARVVKEADLGKERPASLLVVGVPRVDLPGSRSALGLAPDADTVFTLRERTGGFTAVFQAAPGADAQAVRLAASKVTHYGSFGLLGFAKGNNVAKESLEPKATPLVRELVQ